MLDLGDRTSVYQPVQGNLKFPQELKTNDLAELRLHRKKHLVAACRALPIGDSTMVFAGHLTIRDPEYPDLYWTNPFAVHFAQVKLSKLILVNHDGEVVEGEYAVNQAGFVLHAAVHAAHPDILATCHAHTVYGTACSALGGRCRQSPKTLARFSRTTPQSWKRQVKSRSSVAPATTLHPHLLVSRQPSTRTMVY